MMNTYDLLKHIYQQLKVLLTITGQTYQNIVVDKEKVIRNRKSIKPLDKTRTLPAIINMVAIADSRTIPKKVLMNHDHHITPLLNPIIFIS